MNTLNIISSLSGIIAFFIALYKWKHLDKILRVFVLFLALVVIVEFISLVDVLNKWTTVPLWNIYMLIESLLLVNILLSWTKFGRIRTGLTVALIFLWSGFYVETLNLEFLFWEYLMVFVLSIVAIVNGIGNSWILLGLLIYSIAMVMNLTSGSFDTQVNSSANIVMNLFFCVGLWRCKELL